MKFGVVSDNHFDAETLEMIFEREKDVELWIHCGDSQFSPSHKLMEKCICVRGNNDEIRYENEQIVQIENTQVLVTHGHLYGIDYTDSEIVESALVQEADVVFHGHTHVPRDIMHEGVRIINPGSTSWPRGGFTFGTYAIIDTQKQQASQWDVTFISTKEWVPVDLKNQNKAKKWWQK